jgi:outer membrane lipoprotein carrier protein
VPGIRKTCRTIHLEPESTLNLIRVMMKYIFAIWMLFVIPVSAQAGAIDKLKTFIATTHSARANFTQQVLDQNGNQIQNASGIMEFQRPGKFRWTYQKPYEQLIVGDGSKFWLYDADLNQVTVRKLDAALGSSPAALLSGSNEIERGFTLTEDGKRDGLEWLQATPKGKGPGNKVQDSSFNSILMGFNAQAELAVMELNDMFGHKTVLRFSAMQRNPKFSEQLFKFTPPKGADVLSN